MRLITNIKNTQAAVAIDDLETDLPIMDDDDLIRQQPKSILGLPILNQGHFI